MPLKVKKDLPQRRAAICDSMESMIWNANETLEEALHPKTKQIPPELFQKCHGICLLALVKGAFMVSFHAATGILMAKTNPDKLDESEWSPPVSVYLGGYGFGPVIGYKDENVLLFIMDAETMQDFTERPQTRIGLTAASTLCRSGCQLTKGIDLPGKKTVTIAYSQYAYVGATLEMHSLYTARPFHNTKFYGKKATTADIIYKPGHVTIPKDTLIPDIVRKLDLLAKGETWVAGEMDRSKTMRHIDIAKKAEKTVKEELKNSRHNAVKLAPAPPMDV
eukprot:scaffold2168_cov180-Amphora_coffeaeformis.AAC.4